MRIVVVAATSLEIEPLAAKLQCPVPAAPSLTHIDYLHHQIELLVTGVGMVATAAWCSRMFAERKYDLAFNIGVCGTFDESIPLATVVHVVTDRIAELGAEDGERFLSIYEMNLLAPDAYPFKNGQLVNARPPANSALDGLPRVAGITVNTVHGDERSIALARARFGAQIESMEGAAFMYACLIHDLAFAQVRGVSNLIERRNRDAWNMKDAIANLGDAAVRLLDHA